MSSDRLTIKFAAPSWQQQSDGRIFWFYGVIASFIPLALGWPGIPLTLAALGGLGWIAHRYFQQKLVIDQFGVTIVRMRGEQQIAFDDVIAFVGDEFVSFRGEDVQGGLNVGLEARNEIARYLQRNVPEIAVNPVEPWIDRRGHWHSELHGSDPLETIRSIRRAAFGRWFMEVKVLDEHRFQGIAHTLAGPPGLWAGDEHATLREATDDAVRMIGELRHQE